MQSNNADVVNKFIFRYLNVPLTDGFRYILVSITNKDIFNKFIELNKFLSNVCIIRVNKFLLFLLTNSLVYSNFLNFCSNLCSYGQVRLLSPQVVIENGSAVPMYLNLY